MVFKIVENQVLKVDCGPIIAGGNGDNLIKNEKLVGECVKTERKEYFEIVFICIIEDRSNDYGTKFVKMYEDMAKAKGYNKIIAKCEKSNKRGINFWENHAGWTRRECVEDQWIFYKDL